MRNSVDAPGSDDHPTASWLVWALLGAIVSILFSALQKYQLGVPVTNPWDA